MASVIVAGDSSGAITISAPSAAGSGTLTLPIATDTLVGKATTDTLTNKTLVAPALGAATATSLTVSGDVLVTTPAGLGYGTGSGGTVTQATSKSTAVTLNKPTGQITMNNAALLPATSVFFDVNDSLVAATDSVLLTLSNFSALNYTIKCFVSTGKFTVILKNETAGSLSEAVVFNFSIIKGATS